MKYLSSSKKSVQELIVQLHQSGVIHVVISPGSRNAPLIISFGNHPEFKCHSIIDERSAAYFALGLSKQIAEPVALICTSGTAALNYSSALAEAYYQEISLIAITADRPPELIGQEDGQTINQRNVFDNFVTYSANLMLDKHTNKQNFNKNEIQKAIVACRKPIKAPVHINIPFEEPLYETKIIETLHKADIIKPEPNINFDSSTLKDNWNSTNNIMIVCGVGLPNKELNKALNKLSELKNVPIIASASSNILGENIIWNIDTTIKSIPLNKEINFTPDLLITIGQSVISKPLKQFLRRVKPKYHIDIDENSNEINTYQCLTHKITCNVLAVINYINQNLSAKPGTYLKLFKQQADKAQTNSNKFIETVEWCDLKLFHIFFDSLKNKINLHLANSTPVRYAELFEPNKNISYYTNRGTSGIDGCTSTAVGAATETSKPTILITGDISFMYDTNALLNIKLPKNLKIIVINNNGGNIFNVIPGPAKSGQIQYFSTPPSASIKHICLAHQVNYLHANNQVEFTEQLSVLMNNTSACTVLEVSTPTNLSAKAFKEFLG